MGGAMNRYVARSGILAVLFSLLLLPPAYSQGAEPEHAIFLPLVESGSTPSPTPQVVEISPEMYVAQPAPDPSIGYGPTGAVLDFGRMRRCTPEDYKYLGAPLADIPKQHLQPDNASTEGCLADYVVLEPDFSTLEGVEFYTGAPSGTDSTAPQPSSGEEVDDYFIPRKFAVYTLNCGASCNSSNGVRGVQASFTVRNPSLPTNDGYFYGNFIGARNTAGPITCQNGQSALPRIQLGLGKGRLGYDPNSGGIVVSGSLVVYRETFVHGSCYVYVSNVSFPSNDPHGINLQVFVSQQIGTTYWSGRIWTYTGGWVYLFSNVPTSFLNYPAPSAFAGQEIGSVSNSFTGIRAPLNMTGHIELWTVINGVEVFKPWYDGHLSPALNGKTTVTANAPFNVMDLAHPHYATLSTTVN